MNELEQLKAAKLRGYSLKAFAKYRAKEHEWGTSKRRRLVNQMFITVYTLWHNRLLARKFALVEGYRDQRRFAKVVEVQRVLAGEQKKLVKCMKQSMYSGLFKVDENFAEWEEYTLSSMQLDGAYGYYSSNETMKYNKLEPYVLKSMHRYCGIEQLNYYYEVDVFEYLLAYQKRPKLEMLIKLGLQHIYDREKRYIRWSKKGAAMLGLKKHEVKYLQSGMQLLDYRLIQEYVNKHNPSVGEAKVYQFFFQRRKILARKQISYLANNKEDDKCQNYYDYLNILRDLRIPVTSKIMYPDNIKMAHDEIVKKEKRYRDAKMNEEIAAFSDMFEKLTYEKNGLVVYPCHSVNELIEESDKLSHCVRNYAESVAQRKKMIMFIRKASERNEPYFTVELSDNKIMQCRGKNNRAMEQIVSEFVSDWANRNKLELSL